MHCRTVARYRRQQAKFLNEILCIPLQQQPQNYCPNSHAHLWTISYADRCQFVAMKCQSFHSFICHLMAAGDMTIFQLLNAFAEHLKEQQTEQSFFGNVSTLLFSMHNTFTSILWSTLSTSFVLCSLHSSEFSQPQTGNFTGKRRAALRSYFHCWS